MLATSTQALAGQPAGGNDAGQATGSNNGSNDVASENFVQPPPPTYKANGVTVEEKLGAQLPLDAKFRDQTGVV